MSNSYVMSTGGLECAPTHGKNAVISQVLAICGWYSIKAAYQKDIQGDFLRIRIYMGGMAKVIVRMYSFCCNLLQL